MVIDVTNTANRTGILRAERKGRLGLILSKLETPIKRFDGKLARYVIEDCTLSQDNDNELCCVQGNDYSYWTKKELKQYFVDGRDLFEFLTF